MIVHIPPIAKIEKDAYSASKSMVRPIKVSFSTLILESQPTQQITQLPQFFFTKPGLPSLSGDGRATY